MKINLNSKPTYLIHLYIQSKSSSFNDSASPGNQEEFSKTEWPVNVKAKCK